MTTDDVAYYGPESFIKKKRHPFSLIVEIVNSFGHEIKLIKDIDKYKDSWAAVLRDYKNIITWDGVNRNKNVKDYHNILFFQFHRFHRFNKQNTGNLKLWFDNLGLNHMSSVAQASYQKSVTVENRIFIEKKMKDIFGSRENHLKAKEKKILFLSNGKLWSNRHQRLLSKVMNSKQSDEYEILVRPHPLVKAGSDKKSFADFCRSFYEFRLNNKKIKISMSEKDFSNCEIAVSMGSSSILATAWFGAKSFSFNKCLTGDSSAIFHMNYKMVDENFICRVSEFEYNFEDLLDILYLLYENTSRGDETATDTISIPAINSWIKVLQGKNLPLKTKRGVQLHQKD